MTPFKFTLPPRSPGVYVLKHEPTQRLYVGSSSNLHSRFNEWRQLIQLGGQARGKALADVMKGTLIEDWTFWVVAVTPSAEQARTHEMDVINGIEMRSPGILLNSIGLRASKPKKEGCVQGSVLVLGGVEVDYSEAARYLGCEKESLRKRMAKYRAKGVRHVVVEDLVGVTGGRPKKVS
jgi:hypothetical protein